jgi:hypothetical protein
VPYYVFQVGTHRGVTQQESLYAADAITGTLDPLRLEALPELQPQAEPTRNVVPVRLRPEETAEKLRDHLRRMVFQQGFFRAGNLGLSLDFTGKTLLLPYWAGFFGAGEEASVRVVDGLRGTMEGAKIRAAIVQWLASAPQAAAL